MASQKELSCHKSYSLDAGQPTKLAPLVLFRKSRTNLAPTDKGKKWEMYNAIMVRFSGERWRKWVTSQPLREKRGTVGMKVKAKRLSWIEPRYQVASGPQCLKCSRSLSGKE